MNIWKALLTEEKKRWNSGYGSCKINTVYKSIKQASRSFYSQKVSFLVNGVWPSLYLSPVKKWIVEILCCKTRDLLNTDFV